MINREHITRHIRMYHSKKLDERTDNKEKSIHNNSDKGDYSESDTSRLNEKGYIKEENHLLEIVRLMKGAITVQNKELNFHRDESRRY